MSKSKGKQQVNITILYGLPGSGKSFYSQRNKETRVDFDAIIKSHGPNKFAVLKELNRQTEIKLSRNYYYTRNHAVTIDGLVTTNQQLRDLIDSFTSYFQQYQIIFRLVYWNEDREACLHNDKNRRTISAAAAIKSMPYEKPHFDSFPELSQKRIQPMKVVKKHNAISWISHLLRELDYDPIQIETITDTMQLESKSWCLGGECCTWDDQSSVVEAQAPRQFEELDRLLVYINPEITAIDFRQIKDICCSLFHFSESDYYGGSTDNARHVCDLKQLYECLLNLQFINE